MNSFPVRIQIVREMMGLSKKELSVIIKQSTGAMSGIEDGTRPIPLKALLLLCDYAYTKGVSVTWLMTGKGKRTRTIDESFPSHVELLPGIEITEEEMDMVDLYKQLGKEGRRIVMGELSRQVQLVQLEGDKEKAEHA